MSLADAFSPYVGIVTAIDALLPSADDARHFHVVAVPALAQVTLGREAAVPGQPGSAYGPDFCRARTAALGEAVERYSAAFVAERGLITATARELGPTAVAPESFALFAPEQHALPGFPFVPFTADTRVRWVRGRRLADGTEAWLPAQLVYLGFPQDEPLIGYATSNGLAAGPTAASALLAALLELVERDAFLLAWNARLSFPRLDWEAAPSLLADYRRFLEPSGAVLRAIDLSGVHDVPVVVAVVRGRPGALVVGAGAAPTVERAWRAAVAEAYAVRKAAREAVIAEPDRTFSDDFSEVQDFAAHIQVYAYARHAERASFLDASPVWRDPGTVPWLPGDDPREQVEALVSRLAARGLDVYAVDVTSPDVRELGVTVVRAVAPQLIPLDVRHDSRFLGAPRLRSEPVRLGFAGRPLTFADLNPDPHPFP